VRVHVDEPGRHQEPVGVQLPPAPFVDRPDLDDDTAVDGNVGRPGRSAGPVDDGSPSDHQIVHVTSFADPMREMDKLHTLYDSLMDARRETGDEVVPFHRFAALVKDQVSKLRDSGTGEVAFRVAVKDGKVNFTVRGLKGGGT